MASLEDDLKKLSALSDAELLAPFRARVRGAKIDHIASVFEVQRPLAEARLVQLGLIDDDHISARG